MKHPLETLSRFRVRDVMRNEVVTVRDQDTMLHAAAVLHSYGITGAPVVDSEGRCVGVLSSSDFVNKELTTASISDAGGSAGGSMYMIKSDTPPEDIASHLVEAYMDPLVHTVMPDETMLKAARLLCEERIHRLIVVDNANRPAGILSSLDIVACMVVAIEE